MRAHQMGDDDDSTLVSSAPKEMGATTGLGDLPVSGGNSLMRQDDRAAAALLPDILQEAQRSSLWLQEMLDFAPVGYVTTDAHGIIKQANHAAGELLQAARAFLLEKPLGLFFISEDSRSFY